MCRVIGRQVVNIREKRKKERKLRAEGIAAIARNLKSLGVSTEQMREANGLSEAEIDSL